MRSARTAQTLITTGADFLCVREAMDGGRVARNVENSNKVCRPRELDTRKERGSANNPDVTDDSGAAQSRENWKTREQMEADEARVLAPFAQESGESRGRQYPEPRHAYRTEFQRDRARIIHARAVRRLAYKTQAFLNGSGDDLATPPTHSMGEA